MTFTEINLFGVYVAPMSLMMVAAWVITIALRRFAAGRRRFDGNSITNFAIFP